jgi:hypothetical protein
MKPLLPLLFAFAAGCSHKPAWEADMGKLIDLPIHHAFHEQGPFRIECFDFVGDPDRGGLYGQFRADEFAPVEYIDNDLLVVRFRWLPMRVVCYAYNKAGTRIAQAQWSKFQRTSSQTWVDNVPEKKRL